MISDHEQARVMYCHREFTARFDRRADGRAWH
jgi:hypothetical protein